MNNIEYSEEELKNEIWKDIIGYEGLYQISNLGRVKSLEKTINMIDGRKRHQKEKILSPVISKYGYYVITLWNNKSKQCKVHRLVMTAFILNPDNLPQVNHIDENKLNNRVSNLEWVTALQNNRHSNIAERWHNTGTESTKKAVVQYDLSGNFINEFESASEAARQLGKLSARVNIGNCCNGKLKTSNGYIWKWKN